MRRELDRFVGSIRRNFCGVKKFENTLFKLHEQNLIFKKKVTGRYTQIKSEPRTRFSKIPQICRIMREKFILGSEFLAEKAVSGKWMICSFGLGTASRITNKSVRQSGKRRKVDCVAPDSGQQV